MELFALRMMYDYIIAHHYDISTFQKEATNISSNKKELHLESLWVNAYEYSLQRKIQEELLENSKKEKREKRNIELQAAFCIDVRSEFMRRNLEDTNPHVETIGFAGFFGLPMSLIPSGKDTAVEQYPVLLSSGFTFKEKESSSKSKEYTAKKDWFDFKSTSNSSFAYVESMGLMNFLSYLQRFFFTKKTDHSENIADNINIPQEMHSKLAEAGFNILTNMGLIKNFAPIVALIGHGSTTQNNPLAGALDCGACGGHSGKSNAQVVSKILNIPEVRKLIKEKGIHIPSETTFISGLHCTTTDEVHFFDTEKLNDSQKGIFQKVNSDFQLATKKASEEKRKRYTPTERQDAVTKSKNWAETRPEWGLVDNCYFIAARREVTKGINLRGRSFLHSYNVEDDEQSNVLNLIMNAPMVVGHWINMQYYASTVNHSIYGMGPKQLHNVAGTFGVFEGNRSDLKIGLSWQSIHDGDKYLHNPSRLQVIIEAPEEKIKGVIEKSPLVKQLIENQWILISALDGETKKLTPLNF